MPRKIKSKTHRKRTLVPAHLETIARGVGRWVWESRQRRRREVGAMGLSSRPCPAASIGVPGSLHERGIPRSAVPVREAGEKAAQAAQAAPAAPAAPPDESCGAGSPRDGGMRLQCNHPSAQQQAQAWGMRQERENKDNATEFHARSPAEGRGIFGLARRGNG